VLNTTVRVLWDKHNCPKVPLWRMTKVISLRWSSALCQLETRFTKLGRSYGWNLTVVRSTTAPHTSPDPSVLAHPLQSVEQSPRKENERRLLPAL
jgi:hypothetical protein